MDSERHLCLGNADNLDAHPRFDFERIQNSFERLIAKGYTVRIDPRAVRIRSTNGEIVFEMEVP